MGVSRKVSWGIRNASSDGRPALALLCRFSHRLETILDVLRYALKIFASGLGSRGYLFDMRKGIRIICLFAKFFKKRMNFSENKEHFAATTGLQKKFFVKHAL